MRIRWPIHVAVGGAVLACLAVVAAGAARASAGVEQAAVDVALGDFAVASLLAKESPTTTLVMPDRVQSDPRLELPLNGASYCGPVAVSNSLMGLSRAGYSRLALGSGSSSKQQEDLVRELATLMGTSPYGGTSPSGVLLGLERLLLRRGYAPQKLEYQGWRAHPTRFSTNVRWPRVEWLEAALVEGRGGAWLHAGWYHKVPEGYRRRGGHWLTLVQVEWKPEQLRGGRSGPILVVHDPAPYAGEHEEQVHVELEQLEEGWLFDQEIGLPARGAARLTGQMKLKHPGDIAILDGAVIALLAPLPT